MTPDEPAGSRDGPWEDRGDSLTGSGVSNVPVGRPFRAVLPGDGPEGPSYGSIRQAGRSRREPGSSDRGCWRVRAPRGWAFVPLSPPAACGTLPIKLVGILPLPRYPP